MEESLQKETAEQQLLIGKMLMRNYVETLFALITAYEQAIKIYPLSKEVAAQLESLKKTGRY